MHRAFPVLALSAALFVVGGTAWAGSPSPVCLAASAELDTDGDGLTDRDEACVHATDPLSADTDGDGHADKEEIDGGFSPRYADKRLIQVDSDQDYLNDDWELKLGTGLMDPDTDGDLYLDGTEVAASFDPRSAEPRILEKRIDVSKKDLTLTYRMGDVTLGTALVSTGKRSTPTPSGTFTIQAKVPEKWYRGATWSYPHTKYNLLFTRSKSGLGYYIHGAYWHNKFGIASVSSGCVNVAYADMEPLYWWAQTGTTVVVE